MTSRECDACAKISDFTENKDLFVLFLYLPLCPTICFFPFFLDKKGNKKSRLRTFQLFAIEFVFYGDGAMMSINIDAHHGFFVCPKQNELTSFRHYSVFNGITCRKMAAEKFKAVFIPYSRKAILIAFNTRICIIPS